MNRLLWRSPVFLPRWRAGKIKCRAGSGRLCRAIGRRQRYCKGSLAATTAFMASGGQRYHKGGYNQQEKISFHKTD